MLFKAFWPFVEKLVSPRYLMKNCARPGSHFSVWMLKLILRMRTFRNERYSSILCCVAD